MAELLKKMPVPYEPMKTNRFIIKMSGNNVVEGIPEYLFSGFNLTTEDKEKEIKRETRIEKCIKLTMELKNALHFLTTPDMFIGETKILIEFLDPTGCKFDHYDMVVEFDDFHIGGDYSDSSILTTKVTYWVKSISTNGTDKTDKEAVENYKKKKENVGGGK